LDELSKSIILFKKGNTIHLDAWIECAVESLEQVQITKGSTIVRALGHQEEVVSQDTSLDVLGKKLAEKFQAQYVPTLLKKLGMTPKMARLKRDERADALFNRYAFSGDEQKEILVIDDILTTGATLCAIAKAIRAKASSCAINVFTLAATNRDSSQNDLWKRGVFLNPTLLEGGLAGVQEEAAIYSAGGSLRAKILNDSFH
jgi:predicted amidophosphoribosyltransferase